MTLTEILKQNGLNDEQIQKITGDMKANKVFTSGEENIDIRFGKLKTEHDGKLAELAEAQKLIEEMKKASKGNEDLQSKIGTYESQVAALQAELEKTKLESAIKVELLSEKALDVDYLTFKLKEKGELSLDEDGKIKGWADKIAGLKTQFPTQFDSAANKQIIENRLPDDGKGGNGDGNAITADMFAKMGYADRLKLYNDDPEQYELLTGAKSN